MQYFSKIGQGEDSYSQSFHWKTGGKSADPLDLDLDHNLTTCASFFLRKSNDLYVLQVEESNVQADFS